MYNRAELEKEIALLESKKRVQQHALRRQLHYTMQSVKPENIMRSYVFDSGSKPIKKGILATIATVVMGFAGKKFLPGLVSGIGGAANTLLNSINASSRTPANAQKSEIKSGETADNSLVATALTAGAGMLIKTLTKTKSKGKSSNALSSIANTILTTIVIGNIDKISAYINAAIKTDFGKKSPAEVHSKD